ncbi:MAG: TonB-dependent receptor, partial [Ignavibacteriaceae bacterium]
MYTKIAITLLFLQIITISLYADGNIRGTIQDAQTNDPLPYSNIVLLGTSWGASADAEGRYNISSIPAGTYTLRASYVGYKTEEATVEIINGRTIEFDFKLNAESIEGETVVITAQAEGQLQAINEQLNSIAVKSVVSAAKIKELPDANAAESVSRLPGVSLLRTGGEGSKVVIRGLSPQFNQITIDGVEMSSNVASGNNLVSTDKNLQENTSGFGSNVDVLGDRAADLSMISSSMLGGIEVIKAITPDMDATLIGGVVNFGMRKASSLGLSDRVIQSDMLPTIQISSQGGYSNLKDEYGNYKLTLSLEKRFFNESFGVFIQGSNEHRNLSSNELGAEYILRDKDRGDEGIPELNSLNLTDYFRERKRQNVTFNMDYRHETGNIDVMNLFSTSNTKSIGREQRIVAAPLNDIWYAGTDIRNDLNVITNLISIKQDIPIFHIDLKLSHSYSESENPQDIYFNFFQDDAGLEGDLTKVHPSTLARLAVFDSVNNELDQIQSSSTFSRDRSYSSALDLTTDIPINNFLSAKFKFGGSYLYRTRTYNYDVSSGSHRFSGGGSVSSRIQDILGIDDLNLYNFGGDYDFGDFLEGEYRLAYPALNVELMRSILPQLQNINSLEGYQSNRLGSRINDYTGNETKSAVYGMITLKIGEDVTILPGVRYQNLETEYTALRAEGTPGGFQGRDSTVSRSHGYVLPMVHLRYKPLDWLQIHFAYTNTLNYPDYSAITPRVFIGSDFVQYNNVDLKPARSENFDLIASVYSNEVGLLSANIFKKNIKDLIFYDRTYKINFSEYPDLPQG